jgi:hypothetical protein
VGIGVSLVLIAIGAILAFAVSATFSGFSVATIGVILMAIGVVGLIIDLAIFMPRRRSVATTRTATTDPYVAGSSQTVVQERSTI